MRMAAIRVKQARKGWTGCKLLMPLATLAMDVNQVLTIEARRATKGKSSRMEGWSGRYPLNGGIRGETARGNCGRGTWWLNPDGGGSGRRSRRGCRKRGFSTRGRASVGESSSNGRMRVRMHQMGSLRRNRKRYGRWYDLVDDKVESLASLVLGSKRARQFL